MKICKPLLILNFLNFMVILKKVKMNKENTESEILI